MMLSCLLKPESLVTLFKKSHLQCSDRTTAVVRAIEAQLKFHVTLEIITVIPWAGMGGDISSFMIFFFPMVDGLIAG